MKIGKEVLELLGRKFKLGKWQFITIALQGIPRDWTGCLTRDRYTECRFNLFSSPDKTKPYVQFVHPEIPHLWVRYEATFLEYIPEQDMRNQKV